MIIKAKKDLKNYRKAAEISLGVLNTLRKNLKVGMSSLELDELAGEEMKSRGVVSSFKGVPGVKGPFKFNTCISVNNEILHGIPNERVFKKGDLVKIDLGVIYEGLYTDHCYTFVIKDYLDENDEQLVNTGKLAVESAVKKAVAGNTTGDLGFTMHSIAQMAGFDTLKEYIGHGIGRGLHDEPEIPAYGNPGEGDELEEGMVICIECQVVEGSDRVFTDESGWTIKTKDNGKGVMFEYMVVVQKDKPLILTPNMDWPVIVA
jgi:methionyl aminopeptidase